MYIFTYFKLEHPSRKKETSTWSQWSGPSSQTKQIGLDFYTIIKTTSMAPTYILAAFLYIQLHLQVLSQSQHFLSVKSYTQAVYTVTKLIASTKRSAVRDISKPCLTFGILTFLAGWFALSNKSRNAYMPHLSLCKLQS